MLLLHGQNRGGDDLAAIFMFCLLKSGLQNAHTEFHLMEDFMAESMVRNEDGYSVAIFAACTAAINTFTM